MTHIIILAHFVCITMGSILFYELLRNMAIREKNGFLVAGIGIMNVSFILDAVNIYFRHWYKGYALNDMVEVIGVLLFYISWLLLCAYIIRMAKHGSHVRKKGNIIIFGIYLLCCLLQVLSNFIDHFTFVPWTCLGYLLFCVMQFQYLFREKEEQRDWEEEQKMVQTADEIVNEKGMPEPVEEVANEKGMSEPTEKIANVEITHDSKNESQKELLTARELEIAGYVCEGKSNKEIAEMLFISQNTVRNHIYNIYKKIGVKNKIELIHKLK